MNQKPQLPFIVHRSDEAYGAFAYAYDQALGDRYFRSVRKLLTRILQKYPPARRTHLDLACGSALAMRFFEQQGYVSTGVDASLPMLEMARRRVGRLVAGDLRALPLRGTFGVVTCLYDSLNHLKEPGELAGAFAEARDRMNAESWFFFDVNDPDVYRTIWGIKDPFVAEGEDFHLEMVTRFDGRAGLAFALVRGWAMSAGKRVEIREEHRQRAYSRDDVEDALGRAGLDPVEVREFDPFGESRRVKLVFICRAR